MGIASVVEIPNPDVSDVLLMRHMFCMYVHMFTVHFLSTIFSCSINSRTLLCKEMCIEIERLVKKNTLKA